MSESTAAAIRRSTEEAAVKQIQERIEALLQEPTPTPDHVFKKADELRELQSMTVRVSIFTSPATTPARKAKKPPVSLFSPSENKAPTTPIKRKASVLEEEEEEDDAEMDSGIDGDAEANELRIQCSPEELELFQLVYEYTQEHRHLVDYEDCDEWKRMSVHERRRYNRWIDECRLDREISERRQRPRPRRGRVAPVDRFSPDDYADEPDEGDIEEIDAANSESGGGGIYNEASKLRDLEIARGEKGDLESFFNYEYGYKLYTTGIEQIMAQTGTAGDKVVRQHFSELVFSGLGSAVIKQNLRGQRTKCFLCNMTRVCTYNVSIDQDTYWLGAACKEVAEVLNTLIATIVSPTASVADVETAHKALMIAHAKKSKNK